MTFPIRDVQDVAELHLCSGCGVCEYMTGGLVTMVDDFEKGRRPLLQPGPDARRAAGNALSACPGYALEHSPTVLSGGTHGALGPEWGPVLEVWEGYALDLDIRFAASSGGAATALALYCIEKEGMGGVLHIAARDDVPYLNKTVLSTSRSALLAATGSRYAPASPCDGLALVERSAHACVMIGKPCDIAGATKACAERPALASKLGLTIAIFCAGTPSTRGTIEMMKAMGVDDPNTVRSVRYRGRGWPGKAVVTTHSGATSEMTYEQSWGQILSRHSQWRCRICPDHTGEFADIAVGDPWHRPIPVDEPGRSLIVVRTPRGRSLLYSAIAAGYLHAERVPDATLAHSQPNLLAVRGSVWMRLIVCRLLGVAVPQYKHLPMAMLWFRGLSFKEKLRSVLATAKRVFTRQLRKRHAVEDSLAHVDTGLSRDREPR